jgi:hypothetical protein
MMKEIPLYVKYHTGTCVGCGQWGRAFMFCSYCGDDTGMDNHPEPGVDYDNEDLQPDIPSNDDIEVEETSVESSVDKILILNQSTLAIGTQQWFIPVKTRLQHIYSRTFQFAYQSEKDLSLKTW